MDYLGLFCLGVFVGTIATLGLRRVETIPDWEKVLAFTLPAVLSGAAMVFLDRFKFSPAFGCYPLGLVAALVWAYITVALAHVRKADEPSAWRRALSWAHIVLAFVITAAAGIGTAIPAYLQIKAEWERPDAERLVELQLARDAALRESAPAARPAPAASPAPAAEKPR
jgi:O-antigen ligase